MQDESQTPQRIARLTPLADVLSAIAAQVKPVASQIADAAGARGRVLAADIVVPDGVPLKALALRDGFAVPSDATADAGGYAPALLPDVPQRVGAGEPLPAGTDAVAPLDVIMKRDGT